MNQEQILDKILIKVIGIEEQVRNTATKDDIGEAKSEIMNHVDGFVALNNKLDIELTALRVKYARLEEQLQKVMKHVNYQPN